MTEVTGYVLVCHISTGDTTFLEGIPYACIAVGLTEEDRSLLMIRASPSDPANLLTIKLGLIQALLAAEAANRQVTCYCSDTDPEILDVVF